MEEGRVIDPLDKLPFLARENGRPWPLCRGWTDDERLELRESQLRFVMALAQKLYESAVSYNGDAAKSLAEQCPWLKNGD